MQDLAKRLYWLIFTGSISLFFILLSSFFKTYGSLPISQFFKYDIGKWSSEIDTTFIRMHQRIDALNEISDTLKNFSKMDLNFFYKNYRNSGKYDLFIKYDLAKVTSFLNSIENNDRSAMRNLILELESVREVLNKEIELWHYIGSKSVNIIPYFKQDVGKINKFEFKYNFRLRRDSFESCLYAYTQIHKGGFFWNVIFPPIKSAFFLVASLSVLYFIIFILLPVGIEVWQERKEDGSIKKE